MLPPLPVAAKQEKRVGFLRRRVVRDPVLADCLHSHFAAETVQRACDTCHATVPMTYRPWLTALPPVLVIQLKRFEYQPKTSDFVKISEPIPFPLRDLDMAPFVHGYTRARHGAALYELVGVVLHMGTTDRGHYTAYARSELPPGVAPLKVPAAATVPTTAGPSPAASSSTPPGGVAAAGARAASTAPPPANTNGGSGTYSGVAGGSTSGATSGGGVRGGGAAPPAAPVPAAAAAAAAAAPAGPSGPRYQWFHYDDSRVLPVAEETVADARVACLAYVLFYSKQRAPRGSAM